MLALLRLWRSRQLHDAFRLTEMLDFPRRARNLVAEQASHLV